MYICIYLYYILQVSKKTPFLGPWYVLLLHIHTLYCNIYDIGIGWDIFIYYTTVSRYLRTTKQDTKGKGKRGYPL